MRNKKGFTLIEMMLSMVVILIALLGLYKTVVVSIDSNLRSTLRDEGVRLAEEILNQVRSLDYGDIYPDNGSVWTNVNWNNALGYNPPIYREIRNMRGADAVEYKAVIAVSAAGVQFKQVQVVVGWDHRHENPPGPWTGKEFEYSLETIVRQR